MNNHIEDWEKEYLLKNPLEIFSVYTLVQVGTLNKLMVHTCTLLDKAMETEVIDQNTGGHGIMDAYGMFWLWVLGAFEVTRTMCQASSCLSDKLNLKLRRFKKELAIIRTPFAKQAYAGCKNKPISNELSIAGLNKKTKDMSFVVENKQYWVREFMQKFQNVFKNITLDDIKADQRYSYIKSLSINKLRTATGCKGHGLCRSASAYFQ